MCHPQWKRLEESVLKKKNLKKGISVLSALVCVLSFMELMLKKIISISACQVYVRSGLVLIKETVYFSQKSLFNACHWMICLAGWAQTLSKSQKHKRLTDKMCWLGYYSTAFYTNCIQPTFQQIWQKVKWDIA